MSYAWQGPHAPWDPAVSLGPATPGGKKKLMMVFWWAGSFFLSNNRLVAQGGGRGLGILSSFQSPGPPLSPALLLPGLKEQRVKEGLAAPWTGPPEPEGQLYSHHGSVL